MDPYFVGLDLHNQGDRQLSGDGGRRDRQRREDRGHPERLGQWVVTLPGPWHGGMEATLLQPLDLPPSEAARGPLGDGASGAEEGDFGGQKEERNKLDARTLADLLRANLFPACFVMPPEREGLRRRLRFRRLGVEETVRFKNKTAGLLMETGVEYERRRRPGKRYFGEVMRRDLIDEEPSSGEAKTKTRGPSRFHAVA